jgi:hypothetical protein
MQLNLGRFAVLEVELNRKLLATASPESFRFEAIA